MSNYYSDPTASAAIGAVDRELKQMKKYAARLKRLRSQGRLSCREEMEARHRFRGIYRRLLEKALG